MEIWIYFTLLAAFMQAIRTAGQKQLTVHLNTMATTGVRYLFALPFAWGYLYVLLDYKKLALPTVSHNSEFLQYALIGCVMQILATVCLVAAFSYRNFAVATSLAKIEAILVAVIGSLFFATSLSISGWLCVVIGVLGVLIVSKVKFTVREILTNPGTAFGLASGLAFAITTLSIRQSSLALQMNLIVSAAVTLVFMVTVQSIISFIYLWVQDKSQLMLMLRYWRLSLFVGITSVLGSIGWFTGASLQNAAYVKALGQVEFFITLVITYRIFKEKVSVREYIGMSLILLSVVILLLWA